MPVAILRFMDETTRNPKTRGIQIVAEALRLEDFPLDKFGVNYAVGDIQVQDRAGNSIAVRELMDGINKDEFRSVEEVMKEIHNALGFSRSKAA